MANGDVTDDDQDLGQAPGGQPSGQPVTQPSPPQGEPGNLAAFARSRMGPQISAPGPGNQADSMNMFVQAIQLLKQAGLGLPPGEKIHNDVYKTIQTLSKHLGGAAGLGSAVGIQKTMLGDQLRRTVQNALLSRIVGQQGQGGPPGQGGGGQPQAPMPSTPLPGA